MLPVACLVPAGVKKCFTLNLGDYKSNQVLVLITRFFFVTEEAIDHDPI